MIQCKQKVIKDGLFEIAQGLGGGAKGPLPKSCHTYPRLTKLRTVILYLKKIRKTYKLRDISLEFC